MSVLTNLMGGWFSSFFAQFRYPHHPVRDAWLDRRSIYALFDAYYDNVIYGPAAYGGQRDAINSLLGGSAAKDLAGLYNPVARVVDLYGHVFRGEFGKDILIESDNSRLAEAVYQIWRWSNLTIEKQEMTRLTANQGLCGLRIVADRDARRVYIKPEHPRIIRDVEMDGRGNLTAIELIYDIEVGLGDKKQVIVIREQMTKDEIRTQRQVEQDWIPYDLFSLTDNGPWSVVPNELGVVPYVLMNLSTRNRPWGMNAYYKELPAINDQNSLLTHIGTQIHEHIVGRFVVAAAGQPPQVMKLGGRDVLYINLSSAGGVTPVIQPMVAPLDLPAAISQAAANQRRIENALPELKATEGEYLSGQSGETVAQLRRPAEDKLGLGRDSMQDALKRATQIAVSYAVAYGLYNVGTGLGAQAAERAYRSGAEDFEFNRRPLLPDSQTTTLATAEGLKRIDASEESVWRAAGLDPEIERKRKAAERTTTPAQPVPSGAADAGAGAIKEEVVTDA